MSIDTTTAELFIWIVITLFLIVVPVVLLYKQQLPYVIDIIRNLQNIGLPRINTLPKLNSLPKVNLDRVKWFAQRVKNKSIGKNNNDDFVAGVAIEIAGDPFEEKENVVEEIIILEEFQDIIGDEERAEQANREAFERGSEWFKEWATTNIDKELDTGEEGLIDLDEMASKEQEDISSENLRDKQQADLDMIRFAALSHKERGKLDLYEKKLIEWLALDSNHPELLRLLGDHYFESGNLVKALTILKKIINEESDNHKAIRQIGQIYLQQNQHDTAQLLIEKAIQLKPDNPKYHITMVEIYYANKQLKPAIRSMENVLKLRPTNKNYMLTLAGLHEEMGEPTKAKAYYKKILQIDPSNEVAKRALKRLSFK